MAAASYMCLCNLLEVSTGSRDLGVSAAIVIEDSCTACFLTSAQKESEIATLYGNTCYLLLWVDCRGQLSELTFYCWLEGIQVLVGTDPDSLCHDNSGHRGYYMMLPWVTAQLGQMIKPRPQCSPNFSWR